MDLPTHVDVFSSSKLSVSSDNRSRTYSYMLPLALLQEHRPGTAGVGLLETTERASVWHRCSSSCGLKASQAQVFIHNMLHIWVIVLGQGEREEYRSG